MKRTEVDGQMRISREVGVVSSEYESYMLDLHLIHTLLQGTNGMRKAKTKYLPQEEAETDKAYDARRERTTLYNGFKRTGEKLAGEVFSKNVTVSESVPDEIQGWLKNIDNDGRDINRFGKEVFKQAVYNGASHVLVDFPEVERSITDEGTVVFRDEEIEDPEKQWKPFTQKAIKEKGWHPYCVHYTVKSVIGFQTERKDGKEFLTQLRLREYTNEPDKDNPYGTVEVERIRILTPGIYEVWERIDEDNKELGKNSSTANHAEWVLIAKGESSTKNYIPFYTFMTGQKRNFLMADSALEDLAWINLTHWQSTSEQRNALRYTRFNIWFGKGLATEEGGSIAIGPGRLINGEEEWSELSAVEAKCTSLEAGEKDLESLERKMQMFGLAMFQTGTRTATEKAIDTAEADSILKGWALSFKDFFYVVIGMMADVVENDDDRTDWAVDVNTEFKSYLMDVETKVIASAAIEGWLPKELAFEEFKRRGVLKEEWDWAAVKEMLENEARSTIGYEGLQGGFSVEEEETE